MGDIEIIKLCQKAEQIFSGANVGVMDQFAVTKGKKNYFLLLNCDTLEYEEILVDLQGYTLVLFNTKITHNLGDSAYNQRRSQCENALIKIQNKFSQVKSLSQATEEMIMDCGESLTELEKKRAKYVIAEQKRVEKTVSSLQKNDFLAVGEFLNQSHDGLKNLYEVSCKELDFLTELAKKESSILGARMMGGGFGGCTINLVKKKEIQKISQKMKQSYYDAFGIELGIIDVKIGNGVSLKKS